MNSDPSDEKILERLQALEQTRKDVMARPPEEALDRILNDHQPAALVHSFPMTDFYLLVHDIGPEDCLPLLELASDRQWDYLLDLETWRNDRFDIAAASRWMDLLLTADPDRFVRWALDRRQKYVELYLYRNLEVRIREHDQDPSDFGEDFFSLDNTYYLRVLDLPSAADDTVFNEEHRRAFIDKFLNKMADFHHPTYQGLLLETAHIIPAETEEAALHWRNVRLAEQGFLPFDEAVGIYQPLTVDRLRSRQIARPASAGDGQARLPVPFYPFRELGADTHCFSLALQRIDAEDQRHRIQHEFAGLCNRIIVADHRAVRDKESLREVVKKAVGYLSIGLEQLSGAGEKADPGKAAAAIRRHALIDVFRVGFGRVLALKWRAEKWLDRCWFAASGLRLTFWGEQWMGVLGGLLIKKPLYYDNYRSGTLYREFSAVGEIEEIEAVFEQIKAMDELLSLMAVNLRHPSSYGFLTYKNLLLTAWAASRTGQTGDMLTPLNTAAFRPFFEELLQDDPKAGADEGRVVPETMKRRFLDWLSEQTGLKIFEINSRLGPVLEDLFGDIEAELGRVPAEKLDPRFVNLFLLEQPGHST